VIKLSDDMHDLKLLNIKTSSKILLLIILTVLITIFVPSLECRVYDITSQCDVKKYGNKCYTMDPFPASRRVCVSKLVPNIILYDGQLKY
jgi:hypothetical protein